MKILVVCSGNSGFISPFVQEQVDALISLGINVLIYQVKGKGTFGYLKNLSKLKKKINEFSPDLIHAHYGLSGLLSCMQRDVRVIITFHGSDGYIWYVRLLSKFAAYLSAYNIFVEEKIKNKIGGHKNNSVIPCGIKTDLFFPLEKNTVRKDLGFKIEKKYILFAGGFDNKVKNFTLAKESVKLVDKEIEIIELKNKTRTEVNLLLNACDLLLLTSYSEGSPQIIKEAMACNCPIVSTDVGDVKLLIGNVTGSYITSYTLNEVSEKIKLALDFAEKVGRTKGRERIIALGLDSETVAKKIITIYKGNSLDKLACLRG